MPRPVVLHVSTEQVREWCNRCRTESCMLVVVTMTKTGSLIGVFVYCDRCDT